MVSVGRGDTNYIDVGVVHKHFFQIIVKRNGIANGQFFANFYIRYCHQDRARIVGDHVGMPTSDVSGTYDGEMDDIR
jgi:hypothetical protein